MDKRKYLDLIVLLMISVFVVSVSAQVYYSLSMTSTVGIFGTDVYFVVGGDNGKAGLNVVIGSNGTTATLTGLRAYPNVAFTYGDPVKVRNNGTTAADIRLAPVSVSGGEANFVFVNFILNATGVGTRSLNYTSNGVTWSNTGTSQWISMPATTPDTDWSIIIQTKAVAGAASDSVTIEITVDVE
jgi:hypothetical protein